MLTIGATDVAAMKNFYATTLGWKPVAENKDIAFYQLNGFLLSICDRKMLADFIGIDASGNGFRAVTIGYNVATEAEVLQHYNNLKDKVSILKAPTAAPFGGLFFYFTDIEGNIIEIACNPFVLLGEDKNAVGHKPIGLL